jgi:hypothetical protein
MVTGSCQHIDETNLYQAPECISRYVVEWAGKRSVQNINVVTRQRIAGDQGRILIETLRERFMMII